MTDIEALRAMMRCDVTGNLVGTDTRMIGAQLCECQGCRADAEITRLREDLDRVTRENEALSFDVDRAAKERDEARKSVGVKHDEANRYAHRMLDEQKRAEAAEASLASYKEEVGRLLSAMDREKAYLHGLIDEYAEVGGISDSDLDAAFHRIRDKDSVDAERAEALTKEPPHAER
jgi:chromosome segregation ATPase